MALKNRLIINDGFNPELAWGARFEGIFEFPIIEPIDKIKLPKYLVPFSERNKIKNPREAFVVFYEYDDEFADAIRRPNEFIDDLSRFAGIISPDNSLYRDMPLACQICNIYRSRLIGSYLQRNGITVVGNCRWGDERTYSANLFGEAVAFTSLPRNSVLSIGTYGCIRGRLNRYYFESGLVAMLNHLQPRIVIVYGSMSKELFEKYRNCTQFVHFQDWISLCHKENDNG